LVDNNKEPKKYQIDHYLPTNRDLIDECKDKPVNCPVCGYVGHIIRHLNSEKIDIEKGEIEVKIGVNHGHFLLDKKTKEPRTDEGRNVTHYFKQKMISITLFCYVSYKLKSNKKMPPWIRKRLQDEYGL
jgi:hypothetical protein